MEQFKVECLVLGAGVVGLAVARALAMQGRDVWLVEQEKYVGMHTSSRNSEVIHAGIYYPAGSLKAELCVSGKQLLYQYCEANRVPYQKIGKLIVAKNAAQLDELHSIKKRAKVNKVNDLVFLNQTEVKVLEPALNVSGALFSPSTGILDSHAFMQQLSADFERFGGQLAMHTKLTEPAFRNGKLSFELAGQDARVEADYCVNAAGLSAIELLNGVDGFPQQCLPRAYFAKGSYFSYSAKTPFSHLIYPVPEAGGLGVHLTLDMAGQAKFGPDVEWLRETNHRDLDLTVDQAAASKFEQAVKEYWPEVDRSKMVANYAGVRPKISGPGQPASDFIIQGKETHGIEGLVNLFGIESPGLTASLAIAEKVLLMLD